MGEIYMIRNKITKDVYIGQSKYSGEYRYKQRIAEAEHTDLSSAVYRVYYTCIGKQKICYGFNWKYVKKCID